MINSINYCGGKVDTRHHDQTPSVQTAFAKDIDVRSLVSVIEDLGNPFEEESNDQGDHRPHISEGSSKSTEDWPRTISSF